MNRKAITLSAMLIPGTAAAHPDHLSGSSAGLSHLLTDPFHIVSIGVAVLLIVMLRRYRRAALNRKAR